MSFVPKDNDNKDPGEKITPPGSLKTKQGATDPSQPKSNRVTSKPHESDPKATAGKFSGDNSSRDTIIISTPSFRKGGSSPDDRAPIPPRTGDQDLDYLKAVEASYHDLAQSAAGNKRPQTPPGQSKPVPPRPPKGIRPERKLPSPHSPGTPFGNPHVSHYSDSSDAEHDSGYTAVEDRPLFWHHDAGAVVRPPQPGRLEFHGRFLRSFFSNAETEVNTHMGRDIMDFLKRELDPSDSLLDLVVITGDESNPWATTCGDYISTVWPNSSMKLHLLARRLQICFVSPITSCETISVAQEDGELRIRPPSGQKSCIGNDTLQFRFGGRPSILSDVVEALAWLLGVLQTSPNETIQTSRVRMQDISTPSSAGFDFLFSTSMQPLPSSSSSCWTLLAPKAVTAGDFPVSKRKRLMKGLEVSFDLLCYLCGLEYEVTEDGGVVLYGERSIVYPVRQIGDSVQWHFEARDPLAAGSLAMDLPGARLKVDDIEELREAKRHFLGLWANPRITLGTSESNCSSIAWSRAPEVLSERTPDGIMVGGTLVGPKVLNITLSKTYKIARSRKSTYMADFEAKMQSLSEAPVILYGPSERRGWMVPFTSVILHLARGRAQYQQALSMEISAAQIAANGGQAAFEVIQEYCSNPFRGPTLEGDEERKRAAIQEYINEVWVALDCATRASYKAKKLFRTQIVGYEMADIARTRTLLRMKRHRLEAFATGWTPLLDEVHLALFYEGLHDPIVPLIDESANSPCTRSLWRVLPTGHDFLAVSLPCLKHISEHLNSQGIIEQITREHFWHCPGRRHVFSMCKNTSSHVCNRLQELKTNDWRSREEIREPNQDDLRRYPHGVVCFKYRDGHVVDPGQNPQNLQVVPVRNNANRRHSRSPDSGYSSGGRPNGSLEQGSPSTGQAPDGDTGEVLHPQAENTMPPRQDTSPLPHRPGHVPQGRPDGRHPPRRKPRRRRTSQPQLCVTQ